MNEDAFSFYCGKKFWKQCELSDLIVVKILKEKYDADNVCTSKKIIYKCAVCGGFYKRKYSAIYYPSGFFDTEEGWDISDKYFKIEEPAVDNKSPVNTIPLPLESALALGCAEPEK